MIGHLGRPPHPLGDVPPVHGDWDDDDIQLALYTCYELHYRCFAGVDERWEWDPGLLAFRATLERAFEDGVTEAVGMTRGIGAVEDQLWALARGGVTPANGHPAQEAPSLSAYVAEAGTIDQVRELSVHRSAYQLKEADPHTWAIPRLSGAPKAAMVEIQADEYGGGVESRMHCSLFAMTMSELGLDNRYGAYLDWLPGRTLATVNLISLFGLHRRLRAALVGHLAIFEMTSVVPMSRYAAGLDRLGIGSRGRRFYDVHVEADEHHQTIAARDMAGRLADDEPALADGIMFGARAVMEVERRFSGDVLAAWAKGRSSLCLPLPLEDDRLSAVGR
ncbi:MAG: FIG00660544: hypothetical protein [uncultured Acidimicrobiales bacterium]|uniref:Iron-containing redox enzyme family protein n=1 Tax=uncultured Acidimicrobiales bacterium TaxID=310071 RepID=A0A6J4HCY1_9ACTN|nr:MAG: FIG00660544: hypothetical protein [uncultured Acidimicrobiales bacterium]